MNPLDKDSDCTSAATWLMDGRLHPVACIAGVILILGACAGSKSGSGATHTGGTVGTGGTASPVSTGGIVAASGGNGSGGLTSSGGSTGQGGMTASGGWMSSGGAGMTGSAGAGGTTTVTGGGPGSDGAVASGGATTAMDGGSTEVGTSRDTPAGSGDGAMASTCSRDLLKSAIDAYFKALAAHAASTLPLAANVKFTENGKVLKVGEEGLWKTAGTLKYAHSALDSDGCNAASEAVVPDGSTDIPFALRLKLQDQKITEIETIAVRAGDYKVSGSSFASDTQAIIQSAQTVKWEDSVPAAQRNTRDELVAWMDKYFRIFPKGVCNTTSACKRLENGGGSFSCSTGASCDPGQPSAATKPAIVSHIIFGDAETGIGVGFDLFQGNTDMHMFKMYGGQVYAVHAILGAATSTGWD